MQNLMLSLPIIFAQVGDSGKAILFFIAAVVIVILFFMIFIVKQYKRCPSNRILVVFGKVGAEKASKCIHGGGTFVIPLIQDYAYLNLEPLVIDIPLEGALSQNNIRVNVPSTFTVGISTDPVLMTNAAERLLNLPVHSVQEQAQDIILGQLRLVIATLSIEEINKDREKFMRLINENVAQEVNKIGLELINVNVRDLTDESGYIVAIGKRAAAEAINRAKVEVAQQEREGATGEAIAVKEKVVNVAREQAGAVEGQKKAEQQQRVAVAAFEAEAVKGEMQAKRDREISIAQRHAETIAAMKLAEQEQRVRVATAEATATTGENEQKGTIAESNAKLGEIQAESKRRADVASAKAQESILLAQRDQELARLARDEIAPQEIEKRRIEIAAAAEAAKARIEAQGQADAVLAKYQAEAKGVQLVLEAKAEGYRRLIEACGADSAVGPTLLLIEQLPKLVAEQVKAIQNLKIDKVTVWDQGGSGNGRNATSEFLAGMVGALPRLHEMAEMAGIKLPAALGQLHQRKNDDAGGASDAAAKEIPPKDAPPKPDEPPRRK